MRTNIITILIMLCAVLACKPSKPQIVGEMTYQELSDRLERNEDLVVFDVRTQVEVDAGVIHPQALQIDILKPDFDEGLKALDKTKTYVVYCRSGGRSSQAVAKMKALGFESIYNLEGGYDTWKQMGKRTYKHGPPQ